MKIKLLLLILCLFLTACRETRSPRNYNRDFMFSDGTYAMSVFWVKHIKTGRCFVLYQSGYGRAMVETSKDVCEEN